jgi:transcription elongation factor Elf1
MAMSNRSLKVELYEKDPRCHWCGRVTKLICEPHLREVDSLMATIDHVVSRYHVHRWVKKKKNQRRKVLACYECNHSRSVKETLCLSRAEVLKRSQGFSLSPRGKPKIVKPLSTIREVKKQLSA